VRAGRRAGLPVLAWTLPAAVAARLSAETGQGYSGQPPGRIDLRLRVSRQRRAALLHATQISPAAVLWRGFSCSANASTCAGSCRPRKR
jgi:hypothetical protein